MKMLVVTFEHPQIHDDVRGRPSAQAGVAEAGLGDEVTDIVQHRVLEEALDGRRYVFPRVPAHEVANVVHRERALGFGMVQVPAVAVVDQEQQHEVAVGRACEIPAVPSCIVNAGGAEIVNQVVVVTGDRRELRDREGVRDEQLLHTVRIDLPVFEQPVDGLEGLLDVVLEASSGHLRGAPFRRTSRGCTRWPLAAAIDVARSERSELGLARVFIDEL